MLPLKVIAAAWKGFHLFYLFMFYHGDLHFTRCVWRIRLHVPGGYVGQAVDNMGLLSRSGDR